MPTPHEKEMIKTVHEALEQAGTLFEPIGIDLDPHFLSVILGSMMAAIDAVFAIRDGDMWRGKSDPREIAAELIRVAHMAETEDQ